MNWLRSHTKKTLRVEAYRAGVCLSVVMRTPLEFLGSHARTSFEVGMPGIFNLPFWAIDAALAIRFVRFFGSDSTSQNAGTIRDRDSNPLYWPQS